MVNHSNDIDDDDINSHVYAIDEHDHDNNNNEENNDDDDNRDL